MTDIVIHENGESLVVKKIVIGAGETFVNLYCELENGKVRTYGAFRQEV